MLAEADVAFLRRFMESREKRDEAEVAKKAAEKEYRELEAEVWERLSESPLKPPYKVDLGEPYGEVRFHNKETIYGRILDSDKFMEYLEQRAMVEELVDPEPKIVGQRLNEIVREAYENGASMPPGADFTPRRFVSITRQKD